MSLSGGHILMSTTNKDWKRRRIFFALGTGLLAAFSAVALISKAVERVQDAADRTH